MKQITEQMKLELGPYDDRMKLLHAMQESGLRPVVNRTKTVRRPAAPIGKTARLSSHQRRITTGRSMTSG